MELRAAKVLVVEDNKMLQRTLALCFDRLGVAATIVASSGEAMALLQGDAEFDLLLSDIRLPGELDGVGLAFWAAERIPALRIVLQTAYSNHTDLPFTILKKPYALDKLRQTLSTALAVSADGSF